MSRKDGYAGTLRAVSGLPRAGGVFEGALNHWKVCPDCQRAWMEEKNNYAKRATCVRCGSTRLDRKNYRCMDCRLRDRMTAYYRDALERYWRKLGLRTRPLRRRGALAKAGDGRAVSSGRTTSPAVDHAPQRSRSGGE